MRPQTWDVYEAKCLSSSLMRFLILSSMPLGTTSRLDIWGRAPEIFQPHLRPQHHSVPVVQKLMTRTKERRAVISKTTSGPYQQPYQQAVGW